MRCCHSTHSLFFRVLRGSPGGPAAVCDPNPPRPFARSRKEHKPKLLSPDIFRWGKFQVKEWGPKSSVCTSKPGKSNFFGGISRDFAGISRQSPEKFEKKVCVQFLAPNIARYCDTIAAIPHIARYFLREVSTPPKWCDTPHWFLILHRHIRAIPHFATYLAIIVRYPIKTSTKKFCDTIATRTPFGKLNLLKRGCANSGVFGARSPVVYRKRGRQSRKNIACIARITWIAEFTIGAKIVVSVPLQHDWQYYFVQRPL